MPLPLKVKWIKQSGEHRPPHQRVTHIGGRAGQIGWEHALPLAVEYVEKNIFTYLVAIDEKWHPLEIGRTAHGDKYLQLALEEDGLEKLLSLAPKSDPASPQPPEAQSARSVQNQT
jgi:hypothetical protein